MKKSPARNATPPATEKPYASVEQRNVLHRPGTYVPVAVIDQTPDWVISEASNRHGDAARIKHTMSSDHLLLSGSIQDVRLEYFGGSISTDVFRLFFQDIEVGQIRFYSSRKTILIRFDLPEDFTDCPDFFRGEDEETGEPFQCPAWNTWDEFSKALITNPLNR